MSIEQIKESVRKILQEQLSLGEVADTARLQSDMGADSLDVIEIAMAIEDEFFIEIEDQDAEKLANATVPEIAQALAMHPKVANL